MNSLFTDGTADIIVIEIMMNNFGDRMRRRLVFRINRELELKDKSQRSHSLQANPTIKTGKVLRGVLISDESS